MSAALRRAVPITTLLVLLSCGFEPSGDTRIKPPLLYREWWAKTEACSGRVGDFGRVRWFVVEGHSFDCPGGQCAGRWESGHAIYLASDYEANELVVRHEMLHELLGRPGHPDPPFGPECPLTWSSWRGDRAAIGKGLQPADSTRID